MSLLDKINKPNDIKKIKAADYSKLAEEIRRFLIYKVSKTGGHLASNLGTVELTMALHLYLDFPEDILIWDVGHQAYVHKMLSGQKERFDSLRQLGGMSGFPKRGETECDVFGTGHSSTSISAALGFVKARELKQENNRVIAVIGDGALSGGMALEALNNVADLQTNLTVVLNDNERSISENVGGMANYLGKLRTNVKYKDLKDDVEKAIRNVPYVGASIVEKIKVSKDSIKRFLVSGMWFEDMGLTYIGPIDGHNTSQVLMALQSAGKVEGGALVHVITKKGKGYRKAELHPAKFHGVDPFFVKSGENKAESAGNSYTHVFSDTILELAERDERIVGVTAAMPYGTGLYDLKKSYPDRFFDVGIAEQHAVTFAAGLAAAGMRPVLAVYSTFLQRAYDQILHDVCLQQLPVTFAIDRAGIVGRDGETHQGIYDVAFLTSIPGLTVMAPKNGWELREMLYYAQELGRPAAVRYPRGEAFSGLPDCRKPLEAGKSEVICEGCRVAVLAVGSMVQTAMEVRLSLQAFGLQAAVVNVRFLDCVDSELIAQLSLKCELLVTLEENIRSGGYGQKVADYLCEDNTIQSELLIISLPDDYLKHGSVEELRRENGLDTAAVVQKIVTKLSRKQG